MPGASSLFYRKNDETQTLTISIEACTLLGRMDGNILPFEGDVHESASQWHTYT
jgi:hypothetical protein